MPQVNPLSTMTARSEPMMSLKEITDMLGARHDNAMRMVESVMLRDPTFGLAPQIEEPIITGKGKQELIRTYLFNQPQSIAVASRLNVGLLMLVVNQWLVLTGIRDSGQPTQDVIAGLQAQVAQLEQYNHDLQIERDQAQQSATDARVRAASYAHFYGTDL